MKLKMRMLILMGSLLLLVFAVNVGMASADEPHDSGGGIATAHDAIGIDVGVVFDAVPPDSPARSTNGGPISGAVLANNPLCPAHPSE